MQAHFVKDHLRGGYAPSHLHSFWLCFTQSCRRSKHIRRGCGTADVTSRSAEIETESSVQGGPVLFIQN